MARPANRASLFQRIEGRNTGDQVQQVVEHLQNLLNSKQQYASFREDFGLSISDAMWNARPMQSLAAHIRDQILAFEPRLRDVEIEPDSFDEHMCPSFRIYGTIGTSSVRLILSLHTVYCSVHVTEES
jgi:predicted component of type VI protein secretion system